MAVVSGLASKDKYPALTKVLKKEYHASPYMEKYVPEALFQMGEPAFALERMKQRYTRMLDYAEYTTLFEGWGIGAEGFGGGTINHAWSGGPLTLLSQKVCGIEPTSPGFRTFKISPQLGSLSEASASLETHYGTIQVSIKKKGKRMKFDLQIPEGTSAELIKAKWYPQASRPGAPSSGLVICVFVIFQKTEAKNKYFGKERNLSYICNIYRVLYTKDMEKEKNSKITREEALRRLETARKLKREYVAKLEKRDERRV